MAREKEGYRDALMVLRELFPERIGVSVSEAAKAVGVCTKTISKAIDSGKLSACAIGKGKINKTYMISLPALARWSLGG